MHICVVICTYNRAALLEATLARLCTIAPPATATWDLTVVDNGSSDRTPEVLTGFGSRLPLRVIHEPTNGLSHARNRALAEVRGDYVLWTDDDVEVSERWLPAFEEGVQAFPDAWVFGGPVRPWFPSPPDPDLLEAFPALRVGFCGVDHRQPAGSLRPGQNVYGANMAFDLHRTASLRFDPAFGVGASTLVAGEERDFIRRCRIAGGEVVWLPEMAVRHYVAPHRMNLDYLLRYYHDHAVTVVRRQGVPAGRRVLGVPAWVVRAAITARLRSVLRRYGRNRQAYLLALRDHAYFRGMWRECQARGGPGA